MSLKDKYLKYKKKYLELKYKNQLIYNIKNLAIDTGLSNIVDIPSSLSCSKNMPLFSTNNILDLDCLKLSLDPKKLVPKKCLDIIRNEIQDYYDDFFNYICFPEKYGPEIGFEYDEKYKYVKPINTTLEYTFPIINIPGKEFMGTVDYDYFINKLVNDEDFMKLCLLFDNVAKLILVWLNSLNTLFNLNFTNIQLLDLFKICRQLNNNYKNKLDQSVYNIINLNIGYLENFYSFTSLYYLNELVKIIYNNIVLKLKDLKLDDTKRIDLYKASVNIVNISIPTLKKGRRIPEKIFCLNTLYGIDKLRTTNYDAQDAATKLSELVEFKRQNVVQLILNLFEKEKTNKIIVHLALRFFTDFNTLETEGHSNSLVIYKFADNTFLVIRTEPHRHTNIYCRPSMRKAIRELFKDNKNFFYKDYVIKNPYRVGLQVYEEKKTEIDLKNETDFDKLPPKYQIISPLQGNSGFCASWTMYTTMILLLNHDKSLNSIGDYLGSFFLKNDDIDSYDTLYTLYKHIKLYRSILFVVCFLYRTFGESKFKSIFLEGLIANGVDRKDTLLLLSLVKDFLPQFKEFDLILKSLNKIPVTKQDMKDFDPHYCTDSLFNHKEMCQIEDIIKQITPQEKDTFKCNDTNVTLIGVKQARINEKKYNREAYENMLKTRKSTKIPTNVQDNNWQEKSAIADAIRRGSK
jgi:hypothetical protein